METEFDLLILIGIAYLVFFISVSVIGYYFGSDNAPSKSTRGLISIYSSCSMLFLIFFGLLNSYRLSSEFTNEQIAWVGLLIICLGIKAGFLVGLRSRKNAKNQQIESPS
ncbi:MAG: hypothetical protein ACOYL8_04935 [Patescibacteria group bacterium]